VSSKTGSRLKVIQAAPQDTVRCFADYITVPLPLSNVSLEDAQPHEPVESDASPFLSLPGEVRNEIYGHAADYNDIWAVRAHEKESEVNAKPPPLRLIIAFDKRMKSVSTTSAPTPTTDLASQMMQGLPRTTNDVSLLPARNQVTLTGHDHDALDKLTTPTILLLNRQITREATDILSKKAFILYDRLAGLDSMPFHFPKSYLNHITLPTLQSIKKIVIDLTRDETGRTSSVRICDERLLIKMWEILMEPGCQVEQITVHLPLDYVARYATIWRGPHQVDFGYVSCEAFSTVARVLS